MPKISFIGAGNLGSAIAYEVATRGIAQEIVLIDILKDLAEGQAADIQQALPFRNMTKVRSGDYPDLQGSDVIVLTAGKPRTPDMKDRLELAKINKNILSSIIPHIKQHAPQAIIITITNPMDIINHLLYQQGFSRQKVIGSGGQLDSSRFRSVLGHPTHQVEAHILGEHGEQQIPVFSKVLVNGKKVTYSEPEQQQIMEDIRQSAHKVISKKGATVYAPASNTADMVEAIVKDSRKLMICSVNLQGEYGLYGVSLGVPCVLGKNGIENVEEWDLSIKEHGKLKSAAEKLKGILKEL